MVTDMTFWGFLASYGFLLFILAVMKWCGIRRSHTLAIAGLRMTLQMILAGYILEWLMAARHEYATWFCLSVMMAFAVSRVLSLNRWMNRSFQWTAAVAMAVSGLTVLLFYLFIVLRQGQVSAQYAIPLAGMFFGNMMTGMNLGLKTLHESLEAERVQIGALLDFGGAPREVLLPFLNQSMETALLPTINTMIGMGIVFLPGMMSGQILSGVSPGMAILYQMSVSMGLSAAVCMACFITLYGGCRTLYNDKKQLRFQ